MPLCLCDVLSDHDKSDSTRTTTPSGGPADVAEDPVEKMSCLASSQKLSVGVRKPSPNTPMNTLIPGTSESPGTEVQMSDLSFSATASLVKTASKSLRLYPAGIGTAAPNAVCELASVK